MFPLIMYFQGRETTSTIIFEEDIGRWRLFNEDIRWYIGKVSTREAVTNALQSIGGIF